MYGLAAVVARAVSAAREAVYIIRSSAGVLSNRQQEPTNLASIGLHCT